MSNLLPVTTNPLGVEVVDSRIIAQEIGIDHDNFIETVTTYKAVTESKFGLIPFETEKINGRGRPKRYCLLTEDQALFIATLSRNSDKVVELKALLVESFQEHVEPKPPPCLNSIY